MKNWISTFSCFLALSALTPSYADDCVAMVIQKRHSGKSFDSSKPLMMPDLLTLLEAARMAPSAENAQPWFYIVYQRDQNSDGYQKALSSIGAQDQEWAKNAPVMIAVAASSDMMKDRFTQFDTGSATMSLMLQATSIGVMTHAIGSFDAQALGAALGIPKEATLLCLLATGYPAADESAPPKKRKALKENFFMEQWGSGISAQS